MADRIAAIAVVAPNMEPKNAATTDRPMPFLLMVGALDAVMPAGGPLARALFEFWRRRDRCPPARLASAPGAPTTVEIAGPCAENGDVRYVVVGGVDHLLAAELHRPHLGVPEPLPAHRLERSAIG